MIEEPKGYVANCENCWKECCSDDIDECYPSDGDEFISALKEEG